LNENKERLVGVYARLIRGSKSRKKEALDWILVSKEFGVCKELETVWLMGKWVYANEVGCHGCRGPWVLRERVTWLSGDDRK